MKTKFLRVFALFASVLVLVTCLIVPMSADYFDSSKPLIESDWDYVTVIEWNSFDRLLAGTSDIVANYEGDCYVIFSVNNNRYSISADKFYSDDSSLRLIARDNFGVTDYPFIGYYYSDQRILVERSSDVILVDRYFTDIYQFSITVYHNSSEDIVTSYTSNVVSGTTNMVEPTSNRITSAFTGVMDWITSGLNSVQGVFYANNQLTMLGTLAVIGVAVGVAFLIIGVVQKFLKLRS